MAAPTPCAMRAAIKRGNEPASPHISELVANIAIPRRRMNLMDVFLAILPKRINSPAIIMKYETVTHEAMVTSTPMSVAMVGNATDTIVPSRQSIRPTNPINNNKRVPFLSMLSMAP